MAHFREFILITQLETVAESSHVRILIALKLKALRDRANWQRNYLGCPTSLEAQPEVSRMLSVDAESVRRSVGVGIDVSR